MQDQISTEAGKLPTVKIIYILSLIALGIMMILAFLKPLATGKEYSTVQKEQVTQTEEGWLIKFEVANGEKEQQTYTVEESLDNSKPYRESVTIPGGGTYEYSHHIYREDVAGGMVNYHIYRNSTPEPVEKLTYHLK